RPWTAFSSSRACTPRTWSTTTWRAPTHWRRSFDMDLTRRDFIKLTAASTAAAAGGIALPANARGNVATSSELTRLRWDKAPCRFCGTGCSVNVATRDNRVVATHGDILSPVNRGINCIKGYFLSKIMYGRDRLTQPLLRM